MRPPKDVHTSFRLDEDTYDTIVKIACDQDRTVSNVIRLLLARGLRDWEERVANAEGNTT